MNSHDVELGELRRRLERLEQEVAALRGSRAELSATVPPAGAPTATAVAGEPPVVPPVLPPPAARVVQPSLSDRLAEKFGGVSSTTWVAAAGAVIFLIGAVYGLTVSIQRGWISPPVRVATGLLVGLSAGVAAWRLLTAGRRELGVTLLAVGAGTWTFALYFGAKSAHLFPLGLGFAGAAVATLLAGAIAARVRSDAALGVALAVGLAAPLAFSDGTGTLPGLLTYLAALLGAQLAAHYATGEGATWKLSRVLGSLGVMFVALSGASMGRLGDAPLAFAALALVFALELVLAWLPRHAEEPEAPAALSTSALVFTALVAWVIWRRGGYEREWFSVVLVGFSALSLGLVGAARRAGRELNELPLVLTAAGFGLLAVPVAVSWRWVVLAWGLGALLLALGLQAKRRSGEARALGLAADLVSIAATLVWFAWAVDHRKADTIFVNPIFVGGLLTAAAWFVLLRTPGQSRLLTFGAGQLVAVNAVAWELARAIEPVASEEATVAVGALLATLTYAGAGAGLWLRGVLYEVDAAKAKALRLAGYGWLGVAAVKLLGYDLSNRDLLFRAVAALGVGAVFIGAAWWADRARAQREVKS